MITPHQRLLSRTGESFEYAFASYHFSKESKWLRELVRDKRFKMSDTSISYRAITNWDKLGLLPQGVASEGWRRFSLVELLWIKAVKKMRTFGMSLEQIASFKESVMDWNKKTKTYPYFEYYIASAMLSKSDPYIVISNSSVAVMTMDDIETHKSISGSVSLLIISIREILKSVGFEPKQDPYSLWLLSNIEEEILHSLRSGNQREVLVKVRDFKPSDLEVSEEIDPNLWQEIEKDFAQKGVYASTTEQIVNGKKKSKKVTRKQKF